MALEVLHATRVVNKPNRSEKSVSRDAWNEEHLVRGTPGTVLGFDDEGDGIEINLDGIGNVVSSVAGKIGDVELTKEDVGLDTFVNAADFSGTDDAIITAAIAEAVTRGVNVPVHLDRVYTVTSLVNPYGIKFFGEGRIQKAITGGNQQLNSYADVPGRIVYGKEYLYRIYARAMQGQSGPSGQIGCFLFGDSTVASPGYLTVPPEDLLTALFQVRGVGNINITNRGVAGTKVSDMDALADLGPTTDLLIIKYGINDATNPEATRLSTFQEEFDTKLTAIRADANGSVGGLAIVLVGPNATADTSNNRDERWYEQLRGIYVELARKHKCCYIDVYGAFRDARGGENQWLDSLGVHPAPSLGAQIWGLVVDTIVTRDEAVLFGTSNFRNLANNVFLPTVAALPSQWPMGLTVARATSGNGWPIDGFVISIRSPDSGVLQRLFPYAPDNSRCLTRTANVGADTFNRWTGIVENLTTNTTDGWVAFTGYQPTATMLESGHVLVEGGVSSGTTTAATKLAQLPAGMWPAKDAIFVCAGYGGGAGAVVQVKVNASDGGIYLQTTGDASYTMFGFTFLAA